MQQSNQEKFLLIERPNGSLSIGIQPNQTQIVIIECFSCKKLNQCAAKAQYMKCGNCSSVNKIYDTDPISINCIVCERRLEVPKNATLIKCPFCESISELPGK